MGINYTPRTWVDPEIVTDAMLNAEVRDPLAGIQAAWTTYTPTWTGSITNPSIGNGTLAGRYLRLGKTIHVSIEIEAGSSTTFGSGNYSVSLPVAPRSNRRFALNLGLLDASGGAFLSGRAALVSGRLFLVVPATTAGAYDRAVTGSIPFNFATGDQLVITGTYEAD